MAFVVEHHEELELDLHARGVDLLDLWRGRLSFRHLELLIRHSDPGSMVIRKVDPDRAFIASWDTGNYQIHSLINMFGKANFKNWKPTPLPDEIVTSQRADEARRRALVERYEARHPSKSRRRQD